MALREVEAKNVTATTRRRSWFSFLWFPTAFLLAIAAGGMTGILGAYYVNNSRASVEVSSLASFRPSEVTKIYADDGETILAEFALEKRIPLREDEIPKNVENAILAIEDTRFYQHIGIDPWRIGGAAYNILTSDRFEGGSTLTQQIAKNLFLSREQTVTRKVNEWIMALQIERFYTKRQILQMYVNYNNFGGGAYGVEAAAQTYFNKHAKDLTIEEAALIAAIPRSPTKYSPINNPKEAQERRDLVLSQLAKNDYISEADAAKAKAIPVKLADSAYYQSQIPSNDWDFPVEEVRKYLEDKYTTRVAQGGLQVYTTINVEGQKLATQTIRSQLRSYDRQREWRSEYQDILVDPNGQPLSDAKAITKKLESFKHPDWYADDYEKGTFIKGLVVNVDSAKDEAEIRFGRYKAIITAKEMGRSGKKPKDELRPGLLCEFEIVEVNDDNETLKGILSQVPKIEASIVTINSKTGEIPVMVGGYDFATRKFNNATQGLRQTGSCFKPFVYTAALEWGLTPEMLVSGAPIKKWGWRPHNYDGSYSHGNVPMKIALAKSYNIAAVRLLDQVGIQTGAQMVRRFGITNPMSPVLPSALGATEVPLVEMVSAYSVFPNKGIRVEPHLIRKVLDRDGNVLEQWEKTTYKVTSEWAAGEMVDMMQGVVRGGGTASGANAGEHPLAGKTGTVNDHTDVWFIGYTPTYSTGVWMGNPERKESLGRGMTGGHGAVPYFNSFMIPFMKDKPRDSFPPTPDMPADIKDLNERRKREELEKKENGEFDDNGGGTYARTGGSSTVKRKSGGGGGSSTSSSDSEISDGGSSVPTTSVGAPKMDQVTLPSSPRERDDDDKPSTKPENTKPNISPSTKPGDKPNTDKPAAKPDTPKKPEGGNEARPRIAPDAPKKKGKKGDDDN